MTQTKARTMNKPKRRSEPEVIVAMDEPPEVATVVEVVGEVTIEGVTLPIPKRYVPPDCSQCVALRPAGLGFVNVYHTRRESGYVFHYCKCGFCGNTFKDSERV